MNRPKPVVLCILDGWGCRDESAHNAIKTAHTPHLDKIKADCPQCRLGTSGLDVGLPEGQMGNSEVGHMSIGSGRIVMQNLPRINQSIDDGSLAQHNDLHTMITALKKNGGTCHLMGLVSDGGVHAHINHIIALANILAKHEVPVAIHAFMDGRDTPPDSALGYMGVLTRAVANNPHISIATVSGRYYAMDRDQRWERTELAYDAIVNGKGEQADNPIIAIETSYTEHIQDEFIKPYVIQGYQGMQDGDSLLMANFRSDRARQILSALIDPDFDGFTHNRTVDLPGATGMVEYSDRLNELLMVLFPALQPDHTLGEIIANQGMAQLRIAETEKYAHVTFFFNGGREDVFDKEDRILVPSPKVPTYDLQPEMSAPEVTDKLVEAIDSGKYDLIVVNYANTDMVGHTGNMDAAVKAVETVDNALGQLRETIENAGGILLITADHGNAELMEDPETGGPHTAHTTNPVPLIVVNAKTDITLQDGKLCDIAPTILALMELEQPASMTGHSLIQ